MVRFLKLTIAAVMVLAMAAPAVADTCSITSLPTSGVISGSRLNARYSQIEACINGGIAEDNLSSSTAIPTSDLANPNSLTAVSFTLDCAAGTKAASFVPLTDATVVGMSVHVDATSTFDYDVTLKEDTSTITTRAGITSTTALLTSALNTSTTSSNEIIIDITQTTAGTCTAINVVVYLEYAHRS